MALFGSCNVHITLPVLSRGSALGIAVVWLAAKFNATRSESSARALFLGSILYLPLLWIVLVADKL